MAFFWISSPRKTRSELGFLTLLMIGVFAPPNVHSRVLPQTMLRAEKAYATTRSNYLAAATHADTAWRFSKACFELAEYATKDQRRASLAQEGIQSAKAAIESNSNLAAAHFYLALNLGQLARTRMLSALSLIQQMEKAFLRAIELDPHLDCAGPDRSIGLLYMDAPGWPASIGSKRKAREHLERAVDLEPDYPDNHLSLLEAYVRWDDQPRLTKGAERYRLLLPQAKKKYSGSEWEQPWADWEERWEAILGHLDKE